MYNIFLQMTLLCRFLFQESVTPKQDPDLSRLAITESTWDKSFIFSGLHPSSICSYTVYMQCPALYMPHQPMCLQGYTHKQWHKHPLRHWLGSNLWPGAWWLTGNHSILLWVVWLWSRHISHSAARVATSHEQNQRHLYVWETHHCVVLVNKPEALFRLIVLILYLPNIQRFVIAGPISTLTQDVETILVNVGPTL